MGAIGHLHWSMPTIVPIHAGGVPAAVGDGAGVAGGALTTTTGDG